MGVKHKKIHRNKIKKYKQKKLEQEIIKINRKLSKNKKSEGAMGIGNGNKEQE